MGRARVPRYLHLPVQVLWFDIEDIALGILAYVVFVLVIDKWWGYPMVVLVPYAFMSLKAGKPRGYLRHLLYSYGFQKLEGYPLPTVSKFEE